MSAVVDWADRDFIAANYLLEILPAQLVPVWSGNQHGGRVLQSIDILSGTVTPYWTWRGGCFQVKSLNGC